jgi:hypothetical protein
MSEEANPPAAQAIPAGAAVCARCGAVAADGPPLTWATQTSDRGGGLEHLCETCSRVHLRSIEGKLDGDWW